MKLRISFVVLIIALVFTSASAEVRYVLTDLGSVDGSRYYPARAINDSRQILCTAGSNNPIYLWDKGIFTKLGIQSSPYIDKSTDINNAGQVIGTIGLRAYVWQNGVTNDLGVLNGNYTRAYSINNAGQIVGESGGRAFIWENGIISYIPPADWQNIITCAYAISDSGFIAGRKDGVACFWNNGLPSLLGTLDGTSSVALGVNHSGVVVGWSSYSGGGRTAFVYKNGRMMDLGMLGSSGFGKANAVNDRCQIVGLCISYLPIRSLEAIHPKHAVLWEDGMIYDLNDLIAPGSEIIPTEAWDINNRGDIVGEGYAPGKGYRAILLTPWLLDVTIDIRPNAEPNTIDLQSRGLVPVAVFASEEFDTSDIDNGTVYLAGAKAWKHQSADISGDGRNDALFWFRSNELKLFSDSTQAELTGKTAQGRPFRGVDKVVVKGGKEEPTAITPKYSLTELQQPAEIAWCEAYGLNNPGQVVGDAGGNAFIWNNGAMSIISVPDARFGYAVDINDAGQIAMMSNKGAYLWQNGNPTKVEVPGIRAYMAAALNNSGSITGWGPNTGSDPDNWSRYAFVWNNGQGTLLYPPRGESSYASDINDSGVVAGYIDVLDDSAYSTDTFPCMWRDGVARELPLPNRFNEGYATGINNHGDVAGYCWPNNGYGERACIWRDGVPELAKRVCDDSYDRIIKINDWGQAVGSSFSMLPYSGTRTAAVLWKSDIPYDLNTVTQGIPDGWQLWHSAAINNDSQIAVLAWDADGNEKSAILTPIPALVSIDIRPGDPYNTVNPRSRGYVPVAIFSSKECKASSILPETVTLAGVKAERWQSNMDLNRDGKQDLLLMFRTDEMQIPPNSSTATLKGRTFDGWWVEGRDKVTVPGESKKKPIIR